MQNIQDHIISKQAISIYLDIDGYNEKYNEQKTTSFSILTYNAMCLMATRTDDLVFVPDFNPYRVFKFMRDELNMGSFKRNSKTELSNVTLEKIKKLTNQGLDDLAICSALSISKLTLNKYKSQLDQDKDSKGFNSKQSIYSACERLKEQGLIDIQEHPEYGSICVLVYETTANAPKTGDLDDVLKKGFVKFNSFLISEEFFNLELRDQKAVMFFLYNLKDDEKERMINLLSRYERKSKPEQETEFEVILRILKVNRFSHIKKIIENIKKFFNITEVIVSHTKKSFKYSLLQRFRSMKKEKVPTYIPKANKTDISMIHKELMFNKMNLPEKEIEKMASSISIFDNNIRKASIRQFVKQIKNGYSVEKPAGLIRSIAINLKKQLKPST